MLVWFILAHRCLLGKEGKEARQRVSGLPSPTELTYPFLSWTPVLGLCGLPLTQGYFWWPGDGLPQNQRDSLGQAERRLAPARVEVNNSGRDELRLSQERKLPSEQEAYKREALPEGRGRKQSIRMVWLGVEGELEEESLSQKETAQSKGTERGVEAGGWEGKGTR